MPLSLTYPPMVGSTAAYVLSIIGTAPCRICRVGSPGRKSLPAAVTSARYISWRTDERDDGDEVVHQPLGVLEAQVKRLRRRHLRHNVLPCVMIDWMDRGPACFSTSSLICTKRSADTCQC